MARQRAYDLAHEVTKHDELLATKIAQVIEKGMVEVEAGASLGSGSVNDLILAAWAVVDEVSPVSIGHLRGALLGRPVDVPAAKPIPMILTCPACRARHVDRGEFETKPHHTHACQDCGMVWRPAIYPTVGVQFLPGFKDPE